MLTTYSTPALQPESRSVMLPGLEGAGVSASSLVAFKAELYKVQKEQQDIKEGRLDLEELKQVTQQEH